MSARSNSNCAVVRGEVDLSRYEKLDGEWRKIGLAAPARRALVDAGLLKISDLRKITVSELSRLHGIGKTAITLLTRVATFKKE